MCENVKRKEQAYSCNEIMAKCAEVRRSLHVGAGAKVEGASVWGWLSD
jgi:hypothetical protein